MINVTTSRFGGLQVKEDRVINFADGLLGFPEIKRYVLMEYGDTPLKWLQAVDNPDVAFIVASPSVISPGFKVQLQEFERRKLKLQDDADLAVLVILRVEGDKVIANLNGPLAINSRLMVGMQTVADRNN